MSEIATGRMLTASGRPLGSWSSGDRGVEIGWWVRADEPPALQLEGWFSQSEMARIARLRRAEDRHTHLLAHCLVRTMLCARTGDALEASVEHGPDGRPLSRCGLAVSLSHSTTTVAAAVGDGTVVGVDVEDISRAPEVVGVRDLLCHERELALLGSRQPVEMDLLSLWVAKEALVKIGVMPLGEARRIDLSSLLVAAPDEASAEAGKVCGWRMVSHAGYRIGVWRDGHCVGAVGHR